MASPAELEARIQALEDLEAIKRLKYKYLRCLDTKQWDGMAETFAADATTSYSDGELSFSGRDAIMKFLRESAMAERNGMIGVHHVHHPEIELTSPATARGVWALYNYLLHRGDQTGLRLCAFYHDEYVKIDGQWLIKSTGYRRVFEEVWERKDSPSLKLVSG
ncbi:MAG: nuclear transport factor 2 family protein [Candidatus Binataceae bacterium]